MSGRRRSGVVRRNPQACTGSVHRRFAVQESQHDAEGGYHVIFLSHPETIDIDDEISGETYQFTQVKGCSNEKSSAKAIIGICVEI